MTNAIAVEVIATKIFEVKGKKVMLDRDLAKLYGVTTFNLNKAVKRNLDRFPEDFMYQLTRQEAKNLIFQIGISRSRSQIATSNLRCQNGTSNWGGRRYLPYVFTQEGVAMLSSVLNSKRAVQVNILIMRAFVKLREVMSLHKELAYKLKELELKIEGHDTDIKDIFEAIRQLMGLPDAHRKIAGFTSK